MVHLIEKNHNQNFISIIRKTFPKYQKMEEELKNTGLYSIIIIGGM